MKLDLSKVLSNLKSLTNSGDDPKKNEDFRN